MSDSAARFLLQLSRTMRTAAMERNVASLVEIAPGDASQTFPLAVLISWNGADRWAMHLGAETINGETFALVEAGWGLADDLHPVSETVERCSPGSVLLRYYAGLGLLEGWRSAEMRLRPPARAD